MKIKISLVEGEKDRTPGLEADIYGKMQHAAMLRETIMFTIKGKQECQNIW